MWFYSIFTNKSMEKRALPPPLKPKRTRRKEEKRQTKMQRREEKREKARQVPPEQRLLEEQAKRMEEMAEWDRRWAEVGASQAGKPDDDTLANSSLFPNSSEDLSHKEFFVTSKDETSENVEENPFKSSHLNSSSVFSKGQIIRHKEERRERNRQKRGEQKAAVRATNLNASPITIERKKELFLLKKRNLLFHRQKELLILRRMPLFTTKKKGGKGKGNERQRERKPPARYLLTQLGKVAIQTKLRNFMMNGPPRKLCNF